MEDTNCDGCFYLVIRTNEQGDPLAKCHRYPPALFVIDNELNQSYPDAWFRCGEFKKEEVHIPLDPGKKLWRS